MTESKPTLLVAIAAAAFLVAAATPTDTFASCEGQTVDDSYCLGGNIISRTTGSAWSARSQCAGTIQVEVGLNDVSSGVAGDPERFTLDGFNAQRRGTAELSTVSYMKCCDSGTDSLMVDGSSINLCDITEDEYAESIENREQTALCTDEWDDSDAAQYCEPPLIGGHTNDRGTVRCTISASCTPSGLVNSRTKGVNSALGNVSRLYICKDGFSHSECDYNCGDQYCYKQKTVCLSNFEESSAANTCSDLRASVPGPDPDSCTLRARCRDDDGDRQETTLRDVDVSDADDVYNCDGELTEERCHPGFAVWDR